MPPKAAPQSQNTNAPTQSASGQAGPKQRRPRRTNDQIAADKLAAAQARVAKEQKRVSDLQAIAALENQMVEEDANDATPRPNARQNTRALHRTYAHLSLYADGEEASDANPEDADAEESVTEPPTDQEKPPKKKAKSAPKPKARTQIMAARKASVMEVDSEVEIMENLVPDDKDHSNASTTSKSKLVPLFSLSFLSLC
jgi:hypothetical protein